MLQHYFISAFSNNYSDTYRFGFNGQEKDQEIYNNQSITTATFWENDGRIGRRWNLDPKPQIFISDYACFGNNPIWFNDILGDIFGTDNTEQSKNDVKSLAGKYSNIVDFDANGNASINFDLAKNEERFKKKDGTFNQKKFNRFVKKASKDKGVQLIKSLSETEEKYLYQTSGEISFIEDNKKYTMDMSLLSGYKEETAPTGGAAGVIPLSIQPRNDEYPDRKPVDPSISAQLFLAPGVYERKRIISDQNGKIISTEWIVVPRASLLYHELKELYIRTHSKKDYTPAHNQSIKDEGNHYGNSYPGNINKATYY